MNRKTRVRTAAAAAALATSVAIAVTATGAARADNSTPQPAADGDPAATSDAAPPGAAAFAARDELRGSTHYVVTAGDSYWAIAEDILPDGAANGEVLRLTNELMSVNRSKLGYDVAAMLHPGDVVDVPAMPATERPVATSVSAATPSHLVVAGDSYWAIAASVLGTDAAPADVLAKTEQLIELNRARLGYDDPQMLHPGDVVYLDDPVATPATPVTPVEAETPDAPEAAMTPDAGEVEMPVVPLTEKVKEEPKASTEGQTRPDRKPTRAQTPDSPPLSELAIIATSRHFAEATGWIHRNAIAD